MIPFPKQVHSNLHPSASPHLLQFCHLLVVYLSFDLSKTEFDQVKAPLFSLSLETPQWLSVG